MDAEFIFGLHLGGRKTLRASSGDPVDPMAGRLTLRVPEVKKERARSRLKKMRGRPLKKGRVLGGGKAGSPRACEMMLKARKEYEMANKENRRVAKKRVIHVGREKSVLDAKSAPELREERYSDDEDRAQRKRKRPHSEKIPLAVKSVKPYKSGLVRRMKPRAVSPQLHSKATEISLGVTSDSRARTSVVTANPQRDLYGSLRRPLGVVDVSKCKTRERPISETSGPLTTSAERKRPLEKLARADRLVNGIIGHTSIGRIFSSWGQQCARRVLSFCKEVQVSENPNPPARKKSHVEELFQVDKKVNEAADKQDIEILTSSRDLVVRRARPSCQEDLPFEASEDYVSPSNDERLRKLTEEELRTVKSLTMKVGREDVLAEISTANIQLKGQDFARLRGCRWLNDELINSFTSLINQRNKTFHGSHSSPASQATRPRTYVFNTFFFTRLTQCGYDFDGVKRWTRKAGINVYHLDRILVPVNLGNYHWLLAMIDKQKKEFVYMDSLHGPDTHSVLKSLRRWLVDEIKDKCEPDVSGQFNVEEWKDVINPDYVPRQRDDGSCGVFTVYMADYMELNKRPDFTQLDLRVLRQRMALYFKDAALPVG